MHREGPYRPKNIIVEVQDYTNRGNIAVVATEQPGIFMIWIQVIEFGGEYWESCEENYDSLAKAMIAIAHVIKVKYYE